MVDDIIYVAAYCRVSTDEDDQLNSLENQIGYYTEYIKNHENWELYEVFYDEGLSGTTIRHRDGFNRMIQAAYSGKFQLLITKEVSRFARNTVDTLQYVRELKRRNVGVIFTLDGIDTRQNDGELRLTIMASCAQEESRKTSERVKWGQKRQMEKGVVFGRDLLGYTVKNGQLFINEEEAEIVRLIFHKYVNEGKGTFVISRELYEAGIKSKRGKEWTNAVILKVLRNEKYVGDLLQKKTYTPDFLTHEKKYNRGAEEQVYIQNHHEAIIDRQTWNRTQEELKRRTTSAEMKRGHANRYWCSGKLKCGECGRTCVCRIRKRKDGSRYRSWRCLENVRHGQEKIDVIGNEVGCNVSSVNEQSLRTAMAYVLKHLITNKDTIIQEMKKEICQIRGENKDQGQEINTLQNKIHNIELKKRKAVDLVLEGLLSKEELKKQTIFYNQEIERYQSKIRQIQSYDAKKEEKIDDIKAYMEEIRRIINFDCENEMVYREVLDHIDICRNKELKIYLKCLPYGIKLKFKTSGGYEKYRTEIIDMQIV